MTGDIECYRGEETCVVMEVCIYVLNNYKIQIKKMCNHP